MALDDSLYDFYTWFAPESLLTDLYREELLTPLTLTTVAIALIGMAVYYYVLNRNSPRNAGLGQWGLSLLISGLITFLAVLITCFQKAADEQPRSQNPADGLLFDQGFGTFAGFALEMMLLAMLLFFVFSIFLKRWSTHAKIRPFLWPDRIR